MQMLMRVELVMHPWLSKKPLNKDDKVQYVPECDSAGAVG